jgi:hypothetical protein
MALLGHHTYVCILTPIGNLYQKSSLIKYAKRL